MSKRIDIIVWGATGYTGSWAADYLAKNYPPTSSDFTWALAGRTLSKLEEIKKDIVKINESCKDIELLTADINDVKSIDGLLSQAKIVVSFAGPSLQCGSQVVDSCLRVGTHYCDITGEATWIKKAIYPNHQVAMDKKILLIPCCGFDSIPSDLAAFIMHDHAKKKLHDEVKNVTAFFSADSFYEKSGSGGGTVRTVLATIASMSPKESREVTDINYLIEHGQIPFKDSQSDYSFWRYNKYFKSYQVPNPMNYVNKKIVIRSASLLKYGSHFSYNDYIKSSSFLFSLFFSLFLSVAIIFLQVPFIRTLVAKSIPPSGVGPKKEKILNAKTKFRLDIRAVTLKHKQIIRGHIQSEMDPAYGETSKMAIESAITLLKNMDSIISSGKTGFQTPSSALGEKLVERLKNAKMEIVID